MLRSLKEVDVSGKRVLVRVDFNVDLDAKGKIIDDFRIWAVLPTINYLREKGAKIILMSHLGDPDGIDKNLSLASVREKLSKLLGKDVLKANGCIGKEIKAMGENLKEGEILLLENLRFYKEEKENSENFAKELASLADIYINDAFSVSHRQHASLVAITKFLPSYAGLLLEKEVNVLKKIMEYPEHPLAVIIGGAKISTKIKLIKNFLSVADDIILGGALANTVLRAKGIAIGKSVIEEEMVEEVKNLEITSTKIHIPVDTIVSVDRNGNAPERIAPVGKTEENELILDIGPETEGLFAEVIKGAKTIIWNGPMGLFEVKKFAHGTEAIAKAITESSCYSVVGGGETISFLDQAGLAGKFSHLSTGGGAMLKFLSGEKLPGIEALDLGFKN